MDELYRKIFADPEFQALQLRRSRFTWCLTAVMTVSYFGYILVIAFRPHWLAHTLGPDTVITWGIPVAVAVIVLGFALTGIYVWRANGAFDVAVDAIVKRLSARG